jgi:GDP-L-fucose synthase
MKPKAKIYIAGHKGMVGAAVVRKLEALGFTILGKNSKELDLRNQAAVNAFFEKEKPEIVVDAAAKVGGIQANQDYPYPFLMDNLQIQNNLIDASLRHDVQKFVFLGSSCIYPRSAPQPIKEAYLLTSELESSNQWYAIAKIAGVKACEAIRRQYGKDFISLMPTNLYGPMDNFDLETSHVLPAMIRKFHEAKQAGDQPVNLWGSGKAMREFLHVDDMAEAVVFALLNPLDEHLYNVGTGTDLSIKELALLIQSIVGHKGEIIWDLTKPEGTPRKLLDVSKLESSGWKSQIGLAAGIKETYNWFVTNHNNLKTVTF